MAGGCYIRQRNLEPCFKCGMQSRSIGTLWESVRNATPKIHVSGQQDCQVIFMRIKFWRALILNKRSHLNTIKQEKRSNELAYICVCMHVCLCVYTYFAPFLHRETVSILFPQIFQGAHDLKQSFILQECSPIKCKSDFTEQRKA